MYLYKFPISFKATVFYCFDHKKPWGNKLSGMMKGMKEAIDKKYASFLPSIIPILNFL
jgi:hypothetical protein